MKSKSGFLKGRPRLAISVLYTNFSSISYRSRVMSVFIPTGNDVITISGIRTYPIDMEMADSKSAFRSIVFSSNFFCISLTV